MTKRTVSAGKTGKKTAASKRTVDELLKIMATLRSPGGCPWDREQTEQTLKAYAIEEVYEVIEAIEEGTPEALKEELGDLLLQIVFLSRIAEEKGEFSFDDVVHTLAEKLIRRHPHVFPQAGEDPGAAGVRNAQDVKRVWRDIKEQEGKYADRTSALDGLPLALPALERARRISQRATRAGLGWPDADEVRAGFMETLSELAGTTGKSSRRSVERALGDSLFLLAHWARLKGVSAEESLRKADRRFGSRFRKVEERLLRGRKAPGPVGRNELLRLWRNRRPAPKKRHKD
jgi:MazG family protein